MKSSLLNSMGFDPAFIIFGMAGLILVLLIMLIVALGKISKLNKKYSTFMRGKNADSLEDAIVKNFEDIAELKESNAVNSGRLDKVIDNMGYCYQKMGIVKYNAFDEMGGKMSFVIALLNRENTGCVINSMHSREGCYTYLKEIIKGESYIELSGEEKEALKDAMDQDDFMSI